MARLQEQLSNDCKSRRLLYCIWQLHTLVYMYLLKCAACSCQDALEALGEEDAACLQEQLKGGAPAKLTAAEGQVFEVTPAMVDISRVQKKLAGRCGTAQGPE